jgi:hypothetical protein
MRHRAALAGALAAACALMAGPASAATVGVLAFVDPGCCAIANGSKLQNDPAGTAGGEPVAVLQRSNGDPIPSLDDRPSQFDDPETVGEAANRSERAGDSFDPEAMAIKDSGELDDNSSDAVSSVAAPEPSVLTRLLMMFADLRVSVFGGP